MATHGIEPIELVVGNLYPFASDPSHRPDRHRRPGHAAGGGQEPRLRRPCWSTRPTTPPCSTSCGPPGATSAAAPPPPGPQGLRPHRRLRRRHRGLARRGAGRGRHHGRRYGRERGGAVAAAHAPSVAGAGPEPPLRREPPSGRGPLPGVGHAQLVGRGDPARPAWPQLPQPVRRRRRLAPGPRSGLPRSGWPGSDRPACTIIKHANPCGAAVADTLAEAYAPGPGVRRAVGLRRHRGLQPPGRRRHGGRHRDRGPGRRDHRPRLRPRRAGADPGQAEEHPGADRPAAPAGPAGRAPVERRVPGPGGRTRCRSTRPGGGW